MKQVLRTVIAVLLLLFPGTVPSAARRPAGPRHPLVLTPGFPIERVSTRQVLVVPTRNPVSVDAPLVFLPPVVWGATAVSLPPPDRLIWQDSELLRQDDGWVDCNFGVDRSGDRVLLEVQGHAQLDFAEVTFENGEVQVVDFQERTYPPGIYELLSDFDGQRVETVRVVANSMSNQTRLRVDVSAEPDSAVSTKAATATLSRDFAAAALKAVDQIRDWQMHVAYTFKNGLPLSEYWVTSDRDRAADALQLAELAEEGEADRAAQTQLVNLFGNVQSWSDARLEDKRHARLANYYTNSGLDSDESFQSNVSCIHTLISMLARRKVPEETTCR
jgi:hypothetical protein